MGFIGKAAKNSEFIKKEAAKLGFDFCGISKADFLKDESARLENWLANGMQGKMAYLENHFDKRLDPKKLVPGAKSVVSLVYNYYPERDLAKADVDMEGDSYNIAKYAYGEDYHFVIKRKLKELLSAFQSYAGKVNGRVFVDSAPIMERVWAQKSGLGWIGKNSLLLNKSMGSFFFLAEMILDIEFEYDGPVNDYCGTCTRCMDACPTDAIPKPYIVDGSKCISYLTIELKDQVPQEFAGKMENWIFGCDICQDVCPWNRFARPHREASFSPSNDLRQFKKNDWDEITKEVFDRIFDKSALKRTKFKGLRRNIEFLRKDIKK